MDTQQLTSLIASNAVEVFSEDHVWEAVRRCLDHDRAGRMAHMAAVLQNVRAAFLSDQYREEWQSAMAAYGLALGKRRALHRAIHTVMPQRVAGRRFHSRFPPSRHAHRPGGHSLCEPP
ncbi:uncharacterized protein LOC129597929 [Paramacrobiotus metropolitanus]|uniref:uncharacterized protein LOC129597929 n=1 Tax=Paramacrobiotus metropolitanus TaxID=2943436 RepID=UPI002445C99D|nr:uncharacterized protein LOC129597929 [Paramacrobiotus metropolitanus]